MLNLPKKITITQKHVDQFLAERRAQTGLTHCCPIHQALRPYMEQDPEVVAFEVGSGWLDVYLGEDRDYDNRMLALDEQARKFIQAVDKMDGYMSLQFPTEIKLLKGPDKK